MMRRYYLLFLLLCLAWPQMVCAQDEPHATMEVRYRVACILDTVANKQLADTFCLRYNDNVSLFYEQATYQNDSLKFNDIEKWQTTMANMLTKSSPANKAGQKYYVLCDLGAKTYRYQDQIAGSTFLYTDSLPSFGWQLLPIYKEVNHHRCQKAIGTYMGRRYEAWFATDMEAKAFPWKFYGLPGLIMEVYDTQQQYRFTFIDAYPCQGEIALFPSRRYKTTKQKFLAEQISYLKDPIGYLESTATVKIKFGNSKHQLAEETANNGRHLPMEILER